MRRHDGEKPFACHVCGKKFRRVCGIRMGAQYLGTTVPGYHGTRVPQYLGVCGTKVQWYQGAMVPGYQGTWVYMGTMVSGWVPGQVGTMALP